MITLFERAYSGISVRHLPGGKQVQTLEEIRLPCGTVIPAGFTCNADSVSRWLGPLYTWLKARTILGAIVHDFYYSIKIPQREADQLFLRAMAWEGVKARYRYPIYNAVRVFGRFYY